MTTPTVQPPDPTPAADPARALSEALGGLGEPDPGTLVIEPPDAGSGSWAGAPCAVAVGGTMWLAYRLRRPVGQGRG